EEAGGGEGIVLGHPVEQGDQAVPEALVLAVSAVLSHRGSPRGRRCADVSRVGKTSKPFNQNRSNRSAPVAARPAGAGQGLQPLSRRGSSGVRWGEPGSGPAGEAIGEGRQDLLGAAEDVADRQPPGSVRAARL